MIASVSRTILETFPPNHSDEIYLQQNNATPPRILEDLHNIVACIGRMTKITLLNSPANRTNFNDLDIWFITFIQYPQIRTSESTIDERFNALNADFDQLATITPGNV